MAHRERSEFRYLILIVNIHLFFWVPISQYGFTAETGKGRKAAGALSMPRTIQHETLAMA